MTRSLRIVQIVPRSNTTMETEIPAMLRARESILLERSIFHSRLMTLYMRPLADLVVDYIENEGIEVVDSLTFEIADNLEVGLRDPLQLLEDVRRLNTTVLMSWSYPPVYKCPPYPRFSASKTWSAFPPFRRRFVRHGLCSIDWDSRPSCSRRVRFWPLNGISSDQRPNSLTEVIARVGPHEQNIKF